MSRASDLANVIASGSTDIVAEGTNTTNLQQGLAKAFHQTDFSSTAVTRHSLNITTITDGGGSQHTCNFTNSFSDIYQVWTDGVGDGDHGSATRAMSRITRSASAPVFLCEASSGTNQGNDEDVNMLFHGDLA